MPTPTDCRKCGRLYYGAAGLLCDECEKKAKRPLDAAVDLPRIVRLSDAEKYADPSGPRRMFGCSQERVEEQLRIALDGHPESELWGENGLIAATMRCVEAVGKIEDLVTTDHETKDAFIARVRGILGHNSQAQE